MKRILHLVSVKNVTFKSSYYWLLEQHLPLCFVLRNLFKQDWHFFPFLPHFPKYVTFCILHVGSTKFFSDVSSISSAQQNRRRASDIFLKSQSRLFSTMIAKKRKQEHVVSSEYLWAKTQKSKSKYIDSWRCKRHNRQSFSDMILDLSSMNSAWKSIKIV